MPYGAPSAASAPGIHLTPVGPLPSTRGKSLKRSYDFAKPSTPRKVTPKSKQPSAELENRPSVDKKKTEPTPKQPKAKVREKETVYTSPERPAFIPPLVNPRRLPVVLNDLEHLKRILSTDAQPMQRIQVNPAHMYLDSGKLFMEDTYTYGFMVLHVDKNDLSVLTLCSPSGHVLIFQATENGLMIPTEVEILLFKADEVRKIALYRPDIDSFKSANGFGNIDLIEVHSVIEKNIPEIDSGILNFLTPDLGETFSFDKFDRTEIAHVITNAVRARAVSYGMWYVATRLAKQASLSPSANISGYMRYAIFSSLPPRYIMTVADPYYVALEDNHLSPQHQAELDAAKAKYEPYFEKSRNRHRQRFTKPFEPFLNDLTKNCTSCGIFIKPKSKHKCSIKDPVCKYPACEDATAHTPFMCRHIRAWCTICQRRGHLAERHHDTQLPPPYLWACYLHWQTLNLDTSYVFHNRRYLNPFFHQFTLYGLPTSKLLKAKPETGVGADNPTAEGHHRPVESSSTMPPPRSSLRKGKSPLRTLIPPPPRYSVNTTFVNQVARRKLTSSTTSESTFDGPVRPPLITPYALKQAITLVTRISLGDEPGTSGTSHQDNIVVTALLNMVEHIQQQQQRKTSSSTAGQASLPGSTVTNMETPSVFSRAVDNSVNNPANRDNLDHVEILRREIAETALNDATNSNPLDYDDGEEEFQGSFSENEANRMLYGDIPSIEHEVETMDDLDPTGTAAIPQGSVTVFYGDPNYIDVPVNVPGLPPVLPATLPSEVQPSGETSSHPTDSNQDAPN